MRGRQKDKKGKIQTKKQHVENIHIEPLHVKSFKPSNDSLHHVSTYRKSKKPAVSTQAWVVKHLKPSSEKPVLFEIEGAMGDFYRLFLGPKEPKGRPIMSESEPVGLMSKLVEGYTPVSSRKINLKNKEHVRQLAEIAVVAMFLEEGDLHEENLGFNAREELIKIDHGQSLWSIAKEFHKGGMGKVIDFSLTADDIRRLPDVREDHTARVCTLDEDEIAAIANDPVFIEAKFKALLKIALMPDQVCKSICEAFISDNGLKNHIAEHLLERRDHLRNTLISMPEFRKYLLDHPDVINEIKYDYAQFNIEFHKGKHTHRKVDLAEVEHNFKTMMNYARDFSLRDLLLDKIEKRLEALSTETSTLAAIKHGLFDQLKASLAEAHTDDEIIHAFDEWKTQTYIAEGDNDKKYDGMTYEAILSTRRKWDPRSTKSSVFISETDELIKDKREKETEPNLLSLIDYSEEENYTGPSTSYSSKSSRAK